MKKILIITYYWAPNGGAGVQRWLKMSKFLQEQGFDVSIYTPKNPEFTAYDATLKVHPAIKVYKRKIWEPYSLYRKLVGGKNANSTNYLTKDKKNGILHQFAQWLRGSVFIPDPRVFWVKPSIRFLSKLIKKENFDVIISTGPPHSMHLIALGLKKKFGTPWIADFRDPWTFIDFYDQLNLSVKADKKNKELEQEVLGLADKVVTVSPSWAKGFEELSNRSIDLVFNGYDHEDFEKEERVTVDKEFSIGYFGAMNLDRNPESLWFVLAEIAKVTDLKKHLKIKLFGAINSYIFERLTFYGLNECVEHIDYVNHKEVVVEMQKTQLLLLVLNDTPNISGIIPGKVYEYLASQRPILCIGQTNGDGAQIIKETEAGEVFEHSEQELLFSFLENNYKEYKKMGVLNSTTNREERYTREEQTVTYKALLDSIG